MTSFQSLSLLQRPLRIFTALPCRLILINSSPERPSSPASSRALIVSYRAFVSGGFFTPFTMGWAPRSPRMRGLAGGAGGTSDSGGPEGRYEGLELVDAIQPANELARDFSR